MKLPQFFILTFVFFLGIFFGKYFFSFPPPSEFNFEPIYEAISIIKDKFYFPEGKIPQNFEKEIIYGAISGMVEKLNDPYSGFFNPQETEEFQEIVKGIYEGIGAEIGKKDNFLVIISPLKDSPAQKAGLKPEDIILKIDGISTEGMRIEEAVKKIRGKAGTKVKLTIKRNEEILEKEIQREKITIPSLDFEIKDNEIAIFKIYHFYENLYPLFEKKSEEILKSNLKKIILDLRNNSGGTLKSAVDIASFFLKKGEIVMKERKREGEIEAIKSEGPGSFSNFKVAILINKGTASAAEILAGALKEKLKATLVGEKTFGKGTVQELISLSDGASLKLTISHWLLPSGKDINEVGIEPDIEIKEDFQLNKDDPQLNEAIKILKKL